VVRAAWSLTFLSIGRDNSVASESRAYATATLGNIFAPAVPAAAIIIAGLIDAGFEDWLFAVGYYLSVFLWVMAFILADLLRLPGAEPSGINVVVMPESQFAQSAMRQIPRAAFQ
jgi:hypothetical protein